MKKDRQHHVWKAYLRAWATKDRLAVLQAGKIRTAHINDVAVQRHFYKLNLLSDEEITYIRKIWIEGSAKHLRPMHEKTLQVFALPPRLRAELTPEMVAANPDHVKELDELIINGEEDYHSNVENEIAPFIERARNGDLSFLDDPKTATLIPYFIALQHFRTATMRERGFRSFKDKFGIDLTRCWNIIAHILATNLGFTLYADRRRGPLRLLENGTAVPFITSDQPTVNILGGNNMEKPPEHFALYYPISPRRALLLDDTDAPCGIADAPITDEVVKRLNSEVVRLSVRQVFAASKEELAPYLEVSEPTAV